jgi:formylglycine-generating enzyme required for sulfatase activity
LGRAADEAFREVELTRDMCMSTLEMTREAYAALTGEDPTIHPDCPDCPVTNVTWHMAAAATNLLSDAAGMAACYDCVGKGAAVQCTTPADPYACEGYRLPTEAEWEVACRAGSDTPFQGGDLVPGTEDSCEGPIVLDSGAALEDEAWVCSTDIGEPMAVGLLAPNPLGLYDMIGNAYEWVHDTYVEYPGDAVDPSGPIHGVGKVNRGGYYSGAPKVARAANRNGFSPDSSWDHIGFRVARTHRP